MKNIFRSFGIAIGLMVSALAFATTAHAAETFVRVSHAVGYGSAEVAGVKLKVELAQMFAIGADQRLEASGLLRDSNGYRQTEATLGALEPVGEYGKQAS